MATFQTLVEATRRYLFSGQSEQYNTLAGAMLSTDTSFTTTYALGGIQAGTIMAVDFEEILILAVNSQINQVTTCVRGFNGTAAAAHALGALITSQPKFSDGRIADQINNELADLSSSENGLYQIKTLSITFNPAIYGYDITGATDIVEIKEVRYRLPGPTRTWPLIKRWVLERDMPTTGTFGDFPSSFALVIYEPAFPGFPIQLKYAAPFGTLVNPTDDLVAVGGLYNEMFDLPPIGAAIRLVAGREIKRSFDESQGEPRRAEEVPPNSQLIGMRNLAALRQARINSERARLNNRYPNALRWG